jgi:putative ABC transport system permease protein
MVFSQTLLVQGVERSLDVGVSRLGADVLVVPGEEQVPFQATLITGVPSGFYMESQKESEVAAVPGVEKTSSQLFVASLSDTPYSSDDIQLVAFDPETDFTVMPWIKESLDRSLGPDDAVVGSDISCYLGEEMIFFGHSFTVAAKLEETGTGLDRLIFVSFRDAYVMAEESSLKAEKKLVVNRGVISAVMVNVEADVFPDIVSSRIKRAVEGITAVTTTQVASSIESQLSGILGAMLFVTATLWTTSTLMIGTVFWMAVNERRREIGLLRAIGATGRFVFKMVVVEALMLTFVGGLLGVIGGGVAMYSFSLLISKSLEVPYLWPTLVQVGRMIGFSLGIAVFTGLVASLIPAFVSSRMEPLHAIRMGE